MTLYDIKAGDIVILHNYGLGADRTLLRVERVTKTQIIFSRDRRFRKSDGYTIGAQSVFTRQRIEVPKEGELEEVRANMRYHTLVRKVGQACEITKLRSMSLETLERIMQALEVEDAD